jgi:hypothetical protein
MDGAAMQLSIRFDHMLKKYHLNDEILYPYCSLFKIIIYTIIFVKKKQEKAYINIDFRFFVVIGTRPGAASIMCPKLRQRNDAASQYCSRVLPVKPFCDVG